MRVFLSALSFLFILGVIAAAGVSYYGWHLYTKAGAPHEDTLFLVEKGQGVSQIADKLAQEGMIEQPLIFRIAARLGGHDQSIHAGEYQIPSGASVKDIIEKMANGEVFNRSITIPEGLTSWQIVQLLRDQMGVDESTVIDIPPEGSLLPDTYHYVRGDDAQMVIERMSAAMTAAIEDTWPQRDENSPILSKAEAVILASIVEKETGVASEREQVAGVFINRLKLGMALQTDPTVIYAITKGKIEDKGNGPLGRRLLTKDLQFESPYNTYKNPSLPPGPIANPGREAIKATLNPAHHDFLYFVADGTGGHVFSKTLDEHNANVAKWRKIRKAQK